MHWKKTPMKKLKESHQIFFLHTYIKPVAASPTYQRA
jgi:hypothetical protein